MVGPCPVLSPSPISFKELDSLKDTFKNLEKSMFLRRRGEVEGCERLCKVFAWPKAAGFYKREKLSTCKPGMFLRLDSLARYGEADKH